MKQTPIEILMALLLCASWGLVACNSTPSDTESDPVFGIERSTDDQPHTIQGRVVSVVTINPEAIAYDRQIIELRLADGSSHVIDIGEQVILPALDIDEGDEVIVEGKSGTAGGREAMIADRIHVDGRWRKMYSPTRYDEN